MALTGTPVRMSERIRVDYAWTPRQREVLDLLVRGRSNAEIAAALGVSLDGAKWHVREILSKLGVQSREEAAEYWRAYNGLGRRFARVFRGVTVGTASRWLVGGAGLVGVAAGGVVVALVVRGGGGSEPGASETPVAAETATPATSAAATPTPALNIGGVPVGTFVVDKNEGLPGGVLYLEAGCTQCDVGPTSLDRVYRDHSGTIHEERLFERPQSRDGESITSIATSEDGYTIVVGVCAAGAYCGGVGDPEPGATVTFHRSVDGGVTWSTIGTVEGGAWVVAAASDGGALVRHQSGGSDGGWRWAYLTLPGEVPVGVREGFDARSPALPFSAGAPPLLLGPDGLSLLELSGPASSQPMFTADLPDGARLEVARQAPGGSSGLWVAIWSQAEGSSVPAGTYAGLFRDRVAAPSVVFQWPRGTSFSYWDGTWVGPDRAVMSITVPGDELGLDASKLVSVPAVVDFRSGYVRPIGEHFSDRVGKGDRSRVRAVGPGSVVRVQGAGDCLNVRETTSTLATSLGCYADGVLLRDRQETRAVEGITWVGVRTPGGAPGWASAEFLDVAGRDMSERPRVQVADARTGDPAIDAVLDALASGEPARIASVMHFAPVPCSYDQEGIAAAPGCPTGAEEGTPVEVIIGAGCEPFFISKEQFLQDPRVPLATGSELYAVAKLDLGREHWPAGSEYALIYAHRADHGTSGTAVYLGGGGISGYSGGCGQSPEAVLQGLPVESLILAPR
jgi:DNA-binding CsgD family transcriptional regulator